MRENFDKAKRRAFRRAVAFSVLCGLLAGLAVTGIFLLAFKLSAVVLDWYIYLVIGIGAAALSFAAVFFAVRPNDKKLAKKLDSEYALGEKAQTLIEFAGADGAMLDLQREDANAAIGAVKYKKPAKKRVALSAAAVAVSLALFASGVLVTQKIIEEPSEPLFEMTDTQLRLLTIVCDNVSSDTVMDSDLRAKYETSLTSLKDYLSDGTVTTSGMVVEVQATMMEISAYTFDANTYDDFITAFSSADGGTPFALAVYNAATVYKTTSNISDYETIASKQRTLADDISDVMEELSSDITTITDSTTFEDNLGTTLQGYMDILQTALISVECSEDDELYTAVSTLHSAFLRYYNYYVNSRDGYTIESYHTGLANALKTFSTDVSNAMYIQTYNCMMDEYVRQSLSDIFGVVLVGLDNPSPTTDGSEEEGGEGGGSGGGGTGSTLYGSDDEIYDPGDGTYKNYGEMLTSTTNSYYSRIQSILTSDDVSDEVKNYIRAYLNKLYGISDE